jgi:hypothetical protein
MGEEKNEQRKSGNKGKEMKWGWKEIETGRNQTQKLKYLARELTAPRRHPAAARSIQQHLARRDMLDARLAIIDGYLGEQAVLAQGFTRMN